MPARAQEAQARHTGKHETQKCKTQIAKCRFSSVTKD